MQQTISVTTYDEFIQQGNDFKKISEFDKASQSYRHGIELKPKEYEAYYLLAEVLYLKSQKTEAKKFFQKALAINQNHFLSLQRLGEISLQAEKYKDSSQYYQRAYNVNPNSNLVCYRLAENYKKLGKLALAVEYYQKSLKLNPESAKTCYQLAILLDKQGKFEEAKEYRNRATQMKPDSTFAWIKLGDALTEQNKLDEAIKCYQTACYQKNIELKPDLQQYDWQETKIFSPNFIIIGVAKCGTTSLFNYLSKHPQVLVPNTKEIDFYSRGFEKGMDWYLSQFPSLAGRPEFITGEASVSYFYAEKADERIFDSTQNTKFIVLLRNPVDRAISWYYYRVKRLQENRNISEAIGSDLERYKTIKAEHLLYHSGYLSPGLYVYKLRRWMNLFDRDRFLILESENFYQNTAVVMDRVYDFLSLERQEHPQYRKYNSGSYDATNDNLRTRLANFFEPHNRKLEEFLDMKFDWS